MPTQEHKWAMVTGSSKGIGRATAILLAKQGWNVAIHARNLSSHLNAVSKEIQQHGVRVQEFAADLEDIAEGPNLVATAWEKVGGFDAWIHIAGVDLLTGKYANAGYEAKLELALTVDLKGTMLTCREVGKRMMQRGHGSIVTIGWDQAATGMEGDSGEIFAATKGGVMSFTRSLAKTLAPTVRVNCVAPGWIKTSWGESASSLWQERVLRETPLQRWGTPEDIANAIGYLIADEASFLTGQILNVNGGVVT